MNMIRINLLISVLFCTLLFVPNSLIIALFCFGFLLFGSFLNSRMFFYLKYALSSKIELEELNKIIQCSGFNMFMSNILMFLTACLAFGLMYFSGYFLIGAIYLIFSSVSIFMSCCVCDKIQEMRGLNEK